MNHMNSSFIALNSQPSFSFQNVDAKFEVLEKTFIYDIRREPVQELFPGNRLRCRIIKNKECWVEVNIRVIQESQTSMWRTPGVSRGWLSKDAILDLNVGTNQCNSPYVAESFSHQKDCFFWMFVSNKCTNLFRKLTQMLPKKAKMTFWWLDVGGTLIRTRSFCSPGLCLATKTFTRPLYISKKIF